MTKEKIDGATAVPFETRRHAHAVLERAKLNDLRLLSCEVSHTLESLKPLPKLVDVQIHAGWKKSDDADAPLLAYDLTFKIFSRFASHDEPAISVVAKYRVDYKMKSLDELTEQNLSAFCSWQALLHVWPYLREFTSAVTTRMGLPGLRLPLLQQGTIALPELVDVSEARGALDPDDETEGSE